MFEGRKSRIKSFNRNKILQIRSIDIILSIILLPFVLRLSYVHITREVEDFLKSAQSSALEPDTVSNAPLSWLISAFPAVSLKRIALNDYF